MKAIKTKDSVGEAFDQMYQRLNDERAGRIATLLKRAAKMGWYDEEALDRESNVADLLADIRHYCDQHGLDFAELDGRGYRNYSAEVVEATTGVAVP